MRQAHEHKGTNMTVKTALILCPDPSEKGGVADYYRLLKKHFHSDRVQLEFLYTGSRSDNAYTNNRILKTLRDAASLVRTAPDFDLVVLNPSLDAKAVIRDGLYHLLAKRIMGKKTLVFFHGWDLEFESVINRHLAKTFSAVFNFDRGVVLARQFKEKLVLWGFEPGRIAVESTVYEQCDLSLDGDVNKMVFLSRFVKGKGCLEAIRTVEILAKRFPEIKLYMAGDGPMTPALKEYVDRRGIGAFVEFTGWLEGMEKNRLLKQCGIMLYPTDFGEGLPICLLEGMGMGLAIVTRPVAGIADIFADGENGYLVRTLNPEDFAAKVQGLLQDHSLWQRISLFNKRQAREKYEIGSAVKRIENHYYEAAL